MPPAVRMCPSPARISVDAPISEARRDAVHDAGVAGLADRRDAAVANADVRLVDAGAVDDDDRRDDEIGRAGARHERRLPHAVADHLPAAELRLLAVDREVALDAHDQIGVGQANPIAGGRAVVVGVGATGSSFITRRERPRARPGRLVAASSSGPLTSPFSPWTWRAPPSATSSTSRSSPGSKRTAVPAAMLSRMPYAGSRSNASQRLTSKKWQCDPTCTGRSPRLLDRDAHGSGGRR